MDPGILYLDRVSGENNPAPISWYQVFFVYLRYQSNHTMSKKKVDYSDVHDSIDWNELETKFLSDPEVKAACDLIQLRLESMLPESVQALDEEDAADFWSLRADTMQDFGPDKDEINVFHVACFQQS